MSNLQYIVFGFLKVLTLSLDFGNTLLQTAKNYRIERPLMIF
jgi:hypothetical protein